MRKTTYSELAILFLMVVTAYGYFYPIGDWNTFSRLSLVKAVVEENRFEIDSFHRTSLITHDESFFNGHYYSDKPIGTALLGILAYSVFYKVFNLLGWSINIIAFQQITTFFGVSLLAAFLGPLIFAFIKKITGKRWFALLIMLSVCLGTPIYIYSTVFYSHVLSGLFLLTVFLLWFNFQDNTETITPFKLLISGYLMAYAFITEYITSIIVFMLFIYIMYVLWRKKYISDPKTYIFLASGILIPCIIVMTYNYEVFKNPFSTGYSYEASELFSKAQQTGLMGIGIPNLKVLFFLTFHTTMGIFWQSPVLLMCFPGWINLWRKNQTEYRIIGILSFAILLLYFLVVSGYYLWWGGLAYTSRHVIPALPFVLIPLAFIPTKLYKITFFLMLVSVFQMFMVVISTNLELGKLTFVPGLSADNFYKMFENSTIYNVAFPNFLLQSYNANLGQQLFGLHGHLSLIPFFIIEIAGILIFLWLGTHKPEGIILETETQEGRRPT